MIVIWIATVALCVFAAWFMHERIKGYSKKDVVLKVVCSVCFLTVGMVAFGMHSSKAGYLLLAGGALGALGDFSLGVSHIRKSEKRICMVLGFLGFGVGHVLYCLALIERYGDWITMPYYVVPVVLAVLLAAGLGIFRRKLGLHFGRLIPVVLTYVFILGFSVFFTVSLNIANEFRRIQLLIFGAGIVLFIISDMILSRMYFGKAERSPVAVIANHVTYYAAQWLIAFSILFV